MNFPSQIFFNDINHGYRATILKKKSLRLFPFYMVVATLFLLWKGAQNDAHCICIKPSDYTWEKNVRRRYYFYSGITIMELYLTLKQHFHTGE